MSRGMNAKFVPFVDIGVDGGAAFTRLQAGIQARHVEPRSESHRRLAHVMLPTKARAAPETLRLAFLKLSQIRDALFQALL